MRNELLDALKAALPTLAKAIPGCAVLTDATGVIVAQADRHGAENARRIGVKLFEPAGGAPESVACPWGAAGAPLRIVSLGSCFLCFESGASNRRIRQTFERALPFIARVAGGEAVLFDREGTRLLSVDSEGNTTTAYVGQVSNLARHSMVTGKPVLGDSTYIVGAKAVRIPVGEDFGIGFNNNNSVAQRQRLIDSLYELQSADTVFGDIVGGSPELEEIKHRAGEVAEAGETVLLSGGKGTGKRMLAQAMHNAGPRKSHPFVTVNCDALDQDLLEGALFGYADAVIRGVMRGRHPGAIVLADAGTLYLVNIDQMDLQLQAKLHTALATGKFFPVGDNEPGKMNAGVIASTDKNLEAMVKVGRFDEELYQLLSGHTITLPPLSRTPEIIPELVSTFIKQLNRQYGTRVESVDMEVMEILERQPWPGNARELRAFLQTILAGMDDSVVIKKHNLPLGLLGQAPDNAGDGAEEDSVYGMLVRDYEAQIIRHALLVHGGSRLKTAEQLGLSKSSLWRKMKKLGIE